MMISPQVTFLLFCTLIFIILLLLSLDIMLLSKLFSRIHKPEKIGFMSDIRKIQNNFAAKLESNQEIKSLESICPINAIEYNSDKHSIRVSKKKCLGVLCLRCFDLLEN